jgi:hypothetical protein
MHLLIKNLLSTFVISTLLAICANCGYYAYLMRGNSYDLQSIALSISGGTLILTVILAIMSLPALFVQNKNYWDNVIVRLLLYFSGSVVYMVASFVQSASYSEKRFHILTGIVFLLVHSVFYFVAVRQPQKKVVK